METIILACISFCILPSKNKLPGACLEPKTKATLRFKVLGANGTAESRVGSTWGWEALGDTHKPGSYLAQFEAVFFGTFFASSANRC